MTEKKLEDYTLDELNEQFVVISNVECGYELGFMEVEKANEIFEQYKESFPLEYEPLVSEERQLMIQENKIVSEDKLKRNIYEEVFDENNNVKPKYLAKDGD